MDTAVRRANLTSHPATLSAGQLARLSFVSTDSLRHYERVGVLPKPRRTPAGYRQYPPEAVARVRMIRRALALGFTLRELARVLRVREKGGAPCREVRPGRAPACWKPWERCPPEKEKRYEIHNSKRCAGIRLRIECAADRRSS